MTQNEKAELLRSLHGGPDLLVLPNAYDAASARIFETEGFDAIATSSAGVAFTLGYPDGQHIPRDQALFMLQRIADTVEVPVTADIEAGYGINSIDEVVETARRVLRVGIVGVNLEDTGEGGTLSDVGLHVQKIAALRELGEAEGVSLVINARTDAFHLDTLTWNERIDESVKRLNAYRAAGADCLFAPFVTDSPTIRTLVEAVDGPLNILAVAGSPSIHELEHLGVRRVTIGGGPCRAALGLVRRIAWELRETGTFESLVEGAIPYAEMNVLMAAPRDRED